MSPQELERLMAECHEEIEQSETKTRQDKSTSSERSFEVMRRDKMGTSTNLRTIHQDPSFEDASKQMISSPAPVVEKGGENEFVKVSHMSSVQVKPVPTLSILKSKSEPRNPVKRSLLRRPEDAMNLSSRSSVKKFRKGNNHKRYIGEDDSDSMKDSLCGEVTSHESSSSVENHCEIEKSPYEPGSCAEDDEPIFRKIKILLMEDDDDSEASMLFGPTNAGCLVKANALIEKSGMVYSQTWTKGSIRGDPVGIIPNHMLLMVLVANRFAKANELLLSGICRDLEVYNCVNHGLDNWGWAKDYELVRATKKNFKFKSNKRDCFKCAIFVARTHSCYLAFGKKELRPGLIMKLRTCLDMMETHLIDPLSNGPNVHAASHGKAASSTSNFTTNVKKRKKMVPDHVLTISSLSSSPLLSTIASKSAIAQNSNRHQDPQIKKKRGRPSKNSKIAPVQQVSSPVLSSSLQLPESEEQNNSNEGKKESMSSKSKRHHLQSNKLRASSRADNAPEPLSPRVVSSSRSAPSLHQLMLQFEDKYNEMGKQYAEMGTILTQMKNAIEENRERSEKEIRRELLDEIQRNILQSMPKR